MTVVALVLALVAVAALALVSVALGRQRRHLRRLAAEVTGLREQLRDAADLPNPRAPQPRPDVAVITAVPIEGSPATALEPTASRVVSVTLAGPLLKAVAFGAGLHRALGEEHRMRVAYVYRKELKRQRKVRRRAAASAARTRHAEGRLS
jgi:hypothetical protein